MSDGGKFKMLKVFDCQHMPKEVKSSFYHLTEGTGNSCYVDWYTSSIEIEDHNQYDEKVITWYRSVDSWLIANGAEMDEHVLVSHTW